MKEKSKRLIIAGISGAVGGALGSVSGSSSWAVVSIVAASIAIITAWLLNGSFK